jgi:hypothetical protein
MLEPDNRHLLLDALRPLPGTKLDAAVGTTFSLDLDALLLAPIAFALFEARVLETGDPERTDPLAVMEAVRRHASRIDLFCQAGQIAVPPRDRPILALLEDSVHPASAPAKGHIFHPKVWCLRFLDSETEAKSYRLLVLSRNLTFDQSWDTVVSIDGVPGKPGAALARQNRPLADFTAALPQTVTRPLPEERSERIERLAGELIDVEWELPKQFSGVEFLPSGVAGYESLWPTRIDRGLVISPFLTASQLAALANQGGSVSLISRPESLDLIDLDILDRFESVYVLDDATDETDSDQSDDAVAATREETAERPGVTSAGIHAKVMVSDQGWDAEFRTGSSNATTAGWGGNVEFDIALRGRRGQCGVDSVLGASTTSTSLDSMLRLYHRSEPEPLPESETEKLAFRLEQLGREIATLGLLVRVEPDSDRYRMILTSDGPLPHAEGVSIKCWPISRHPDTATSLNPGETVHVSQGAMSLQALTSFFVFEIEARRSDAPIATRVVANARMVGAPDDRAERLLLEQLKTKGDVLRYLLFLLADLGDTGAAEFASILSSRAGETSGEWMPQIPLFESMVRALACNPEALTPIDRLIKDLERTEHGRAILPDGIEDIWPAIWEARSRVS